MKANLEVTGVDFSFATTKIRSGVCGFARVQLNGAIYINRVVVVKSKDGTLRVLMPNVIKDKRKLPTVEIMDKSNETSIHDSILSSFNKVVLENNGEYNYKS